MTDILPIRIDSVDFAKIEERLLRDRSLDPHREMAAEIFGVPRDQVTSEQRAIGKTYNYLRAYSNPILPADTQPPSPRPEGVPGGAAPGTARRSPEEEDT